MLSTAASLNLSGAHRPWSARTAGRGPRSGASDITTRTAHSEALIVSGTGCGVDAPGPRRRTRASRRPEGAAPIGARGSTCRPLCTPDLRADAAARFLERRAGVDRNAWVRNGWETAGPCADLPLPADELRVRFVHLLPAVHGRGRGGGSSATSDVRPILQLQALQLAIRHAPRAMQLRSDFDRNFDRTSIGLRETIVVQIRWRKGRILLLKAVAG
jgi:hypothetical protein